MLPVLLAGCFKWDVMIHHQNMDEKPLVKSSLETESVSLQSGYFDGLLQELNRRKIAINVKKFVQRYKGKSLSLSNVTWNYRGLKFSTLKCKSGWFSKTCRVSFSQWVDPKKFPEFQWESPSFTLTVILPKKAYKGSNAHRVTDKGKNKILRWTYRNISPCQTIAFEYEYET